VSLIPVPPAAIVVVVEPPKVTVWSVPGVIAEPEQASAMCTSFTVNGAVPKALEISIRATVPLMLVCTIWRIVCWPNETPPLCGAVAHVPVQ
jgi:hypothetical protein